MPIILIGLLLISWYMLFSDAVSVEKEFKSYLEVARYNKDVGVTLLALENYERALEIKDAPDIYVEVAEYLLSADEDKRYIDWCENFFDTHATEPKAYDCVLKAYFLDNDFEKCYDIIYTSEKRNIKTDYITEIKNTIYYYFDFDRQVYEEVSIFSNFLSPVKNKGYWGFVNRYGVKRASCQYLEVGVYTQSGYAPVKDRDGNVFFIDIDGNKVLATNEKYNRFGPLSDNVIAAQRTDGKFTYLDAKFNVLFGEYDYASTMNLGVAAVKSSDAWSIIDSKGKTISKQTYADVVLDEKEIAYRNERLFVKLGDNQIIMINDKGEQVTNQVFEDCRIFASESYAAVKINGKWGFVDKNGKIVIEPQYDDARSFANGLAAVKVVDKWGFIDENGKICIEPQFYGAKDFNAKGSCFVKVGEEWQLLKLYRLNRED